jgi:hypothetical protein
MPKSGPGGKKEGKALVFLVNLVEETEQQWEEYQTPTPGTPNLTGLEIPARGLRAISKAVRKTRRDFAQNKGPK